jgi:hypothetical protein
MCFDFEQSECNWRYYSMEHHNLHLSYEGEELHIIALLREDDDDLVYDLYTGDILLGTMYPEIDEQNVCIEWKTKDLIAPKLIFMCGAEIERQDR